MCACNAAASQMSLPSLENQSQQGVCMSHCGLAIYIIRKYLKTKEELCKLKKKNSPCKKNYIIFEKIL
jgi:hypothetical protein